MDICVAGLGGGGCRSGQPAVGAGWYDARGDSEAAGQGHGADSRAQKAWTHRPRGPDHPGEPTSLPHAQLAPREFFLHCALIPNYVFFASK